jgi:hypothetical protein
MCLMIQVVRNPNNHLFPAGAETVAGKIQALILVVCDCGIESRWGQARSFLVFAVCCVSSGFCDRLVTHSEECYWISVCVCVCVCV